MADSAALRQRRARAHRRGEHALCGPLCTHHTNTEPETGPIEAATIEFVDESDIRSPFGRSLAALTLRAARECDLSATAGTLRGYRELLQDLSGWVSNEYGGEQGWCETHPDR
jgi:hypothetical protein